MCSWKQLTNALVIRIEQIMIVGVKRPIARNIRREYEGFVKPAGMSKVPFRRTDIGHGLDAIILNQKRFA